MLTKEQKIEKMWFHLEEAFNHLEPHRNKLNQFNEPDFLKDFTKFLDCVSKANQIRKAPDGTQKIN